jgi:type II secretion system protein C
MVGGAPPPTPAPPITREVLTDYMRPSPVFRDEELLGYQIYPGSKANVFSQLGLRPGDVITAINDAPIADVASGIESLKEITNGTSIVVRVERGGKAERLVLDSTLITKDLEGGNSSAVTTPPTDLAGV